MTVKNLDLTEFRGVRALKKPLTLKKFNLIIGRNNTGKTSLLEALSLLPHPLAYHPRPMETEEAKISTLTSLHGISEEVALVYGGEGEACLRFMVNSSKVIIEIGKGKRLFTANGEKFGDSDADKAAKKLKLERDEVVFIPNSEEFLSTIEERLYKEWSMVEKSEAHFTLAQQIGVSTGEKLTEVTPRFSELCLRKVRNGIPIYVRVKDQGSGVRRALLVMLWIESLKPKLILWDDFEASMHPSLIRFALEWLAKGKWQAVLTTHSLDVLGYFADIESDKDAQLIMLGKDRNDVLDYEVYSPSEVDKLLNANTDPRKLAEALGL